LSDFSKILFEEAVFSQTFSDGTDTGVPENVFFCFPNAVWASASSAFRIVSDSLAISATGSKQNNVTVTLAKQKLVGKAS